MKDKKFDNIEIDILKKLIEKEKKKNKKINKDIVYNKIEITKQNENILDKKRILVIPDLHLPFEKVGFLEFCIKMYKEYECNTVVFLGDILDNHFSSFHDTDPDGDFTAKTELNKAKDKIAEWYKAFPNATVTTGNHDNISNRKAFSSGLSKNWIRSIEEVLEVPNWTFLDHIIIDDILFYHGLGQMPKIKSKLEMISCVAGHRHSQSYIEYSVSRFGNRIFGMQLGAGIDQEAYAFAYGKHLQPPHVNIGIIIDKDPLIKYMP